MVDVGMHSHIILKKKEIYKMFIACNANATRTKHQNMHYFILQFFYTAHVIMKSSLRRAVAKFIPEYRSIMLKAPDITGRLGTGSTCTCFVLPCNVRAISDNILESHWVVKED